ncbi:MAG: hypothetical protein AAGB48_07990 [Planctomycetota bacterium]
MTTGISQFTTAALVLVTGTAFGQASATGPAADTVEAASDQPGDEVIDTSAGDLATDVGQGRGSYLLSDERLTPEDSDIGWEGFLDGQRGVDHFYKPVGNPLYFEGAVNDTRVSPLFLYHEFAGGSQLQGGDLTVFAVQVRVALTERLGFIATKDGFSLLDTGTFQDADGWNDIAAGLKYVILDNRETDTIVTGGVRYMLESGSDRVLQGNVAEISPFVSFAQGYEAAQLQGNVTWRAPLDDDDGNHVIQWSGQAAYEVIDGVAPIVGLHGLHYVSDGNRVPFSVGGLDYANLGSADVSGSTVIWADAGVALKLTPNVEVGVNYGFSLTNVNADIMDNRVTALIHFKW